jgi:hypothetical protein
MFAFIYEISQAGYFRFSKYLNSRALSFDLLCNTVIYLNNAGRFVQVFFVFLSYVAVDSSVLRYYQCTMCKITEDVSFFILTEAFL